MKTRFSAILLTAAAALTLTACHTSSGSHGRNASMISRTLLSTTNEYDLDIAADPVEHVIDVTTADGAAKLHKLSLRQAEDLALREAVMKHKCALLFNPQYTHVKKGSRILRVKVYGFPAVYKNQK